MLFYLSSSAGGANGKIKEPKAKNSLHIGRSEKNR
jgi:hypothetical protein